VAAADLHAATHHEVQRLAFFAFVEHDLVRQVAPFVHEAVDELDFQWLEGTEQRRVLQPELAGGQRGRFQETKDHESSGTMQPSGCMSIMNDSLWLSSYKATLGSHRAYRSRVTANRACARLKNV